MRYYNSSPAIGISYCEGCFDKQKRIDQLEEEVTSIRAKLKYKQDKDIKPFFGSQTPSSKLPFKENTLEENRHNKGGAKKGHIGNGRKSIPIDKADEIIDRFVEEELCPDCGYKLEYKETLLRSIVDVCLNKAKNIIYRWEVKRCVNCCKARRRDIMEDRRRESGYSWLFCTDKVSIFNFKDTRSGKVAKEVFGTKKLPGVLVVDRYGAYNKSPCKIEYCYVHLLRRLEDLGKEFPDKREAQVFVSTLAPLLAEAMHLRGSPISGTKYYKRAKKLQAEIRKIIRAPSEHPAVQNYQDIFKKNDHRLYHWVKDRNVPADNNRAERELRPTVIARKVSFGSQSEEGAATRSILMSIIHAVSKRLKDKSLEEWFVWTLEEFSKNPEVDPISLLP